MRRLLAIAAAVALLLPGSGRAQLAAAGGDSQPIQIQADAGIEWQQNAKVYIARGNAVASRGPTELHADTIVAHYRESKGGGNRPGAIGNTGNTEIYRIDADGHVTLKREGQVLTGDHLVYDVDQGVGVVTGKSLKLTTATDTVTARDAFDWYDAKQIAVARGDAVATRNGKTVRADILTGYLTKTAPAKTAAAPRARPAAAKTPPDKAPGSEAADSKLTRVDAQGHVVVTNGPDVGQSDYGVYNAVSGIVTLIGNVVITRDKSILKGQYAVMDLEHNVSRIMPVAAGESGGPPHRVQGLFVRRDADNAAPAKAGPAQGNAGTKP